MVTEYEPAGVSFQPKAPPTSQAPVPASSAPPVQLVGLPARAMGAWQHEETHMLGISTVSVAVGTVVGTRFGGLYGAVAGGLFGGAAVNMIRAGRLALKGQPASDKEALLSATYGIIAAGLGGWLAYAGTKRKRAKEEG